MYDMEEELKLNFLSEAEDTILEAERLIMALESNKDKASHLAELFRVMHNFKGSAAAVGLSGLVQIAHAEESLLSKLKGGTVALTPAVVTLLLRCNDHLSASITQLASNINSDVGNPALVTEVEKVR